MEEQSGAAFSTLVDRHVNKVYSVALRHTGNAHQAQDVTQAVFVLLSLKAQEIGPRVILSGWLYRTAHLTALTWIRSDIRRVNREQEAYRQSELQSQESGTWTQIAPLLDIAIAGLNEADRNALVLRFFDFKSLREVGAALGASEEAAQKRIHRALEKLRVVFQSHGVKSTTEFLAENIPARSMVIAPAALAKDLAAVALRKGALCGPVSALLKGTIKYMAWSNAKTATIVGLALFFVTGATIATFHRFSSPHVLGELSGLPFNELFLGPENPGIEIYSEPRRPEKIAAVTKGDGEINLAGWHYWFHGVKGAGFLYVDSSDPATGANDLTLGNATDGPENCADWRSQKIALGPAGGGRAPLSFSFAYKIPGPAKDGENVEVHLRFLDESGHEVIEEKKVELSSAVNHLNMMRYETVSLKNIRAPKDAWKADIRITVNFPGQPWTSGLARFDDFSLTTPSSFWGRLFR